MTAHQNKPWRLKALAAGLFSGVGLAIILTLVEWHGRCAEFWTRGTHPCSLNEFLFDGFPGFSGYLIVFSCIVAVTTLLVFLTYFIKIKYFKRA